MLVDQLSGDSTVTELRYEGGIASLLYTDGDTGRVFRLRVTTDCLFSEAPAEAGSVHVRLVPIAEVLPIDHRSGLYTAPPEFGPQMAAVREGLHLALGRRAAAFPYLLQVRGYRVVLACPVRAVREVEVVQEGGPV
jgi:hypothetical protein